ncbi:carboxypeptidase regulatory-like domain-containing protein [Ferribacterium limneticum]|uniref:carboxypeptidase regulatory-like domain-containing protein n=1 Tax=Ferribacterium limneticum TaxID=76259 RepID=UPI001CFAF765|nr:carboxypeptidase regulatory-like domain-containing protein [Ferribacterium limneticum]UCV17546.1 carboxypeptidase regulatory-like domain-containing protein [Ferribacterium limneticum]
MTRLFFLVYLLLACLLPSQVLAQGGAYALVEKQYGNVTYVSGGIGDEERDEIRLREVDFNLKLLFSERDGSYLGSVDVVVLNPKGEKVLEANSVGPFLLARLPRGSYVIKVSMNGQEQQRKLSISEKRRSEGVFRW